MDVEGLKKKIEALEDRLCWQKRAIIGLVVVFFFNTTPALTQASNWLNGLLPPKLSSVKLPLGRNVERPDYSDLLPNRDEMISYWAEILPPKNQPGRLNKKALASGSQAGDVLQVRELQIVNAQGTVVAIIGSYDTGDGAVLVLNRKGTLVSVMGTDSRGHGALSLFNTSEHAIVGMGADTSDDANGWIEAQGSSGSGAGLAVDAKGDGFMAIVNKGGTLVSLVGVDKSGHGGLNIFNASERVLAGMGADTSDDAKGWIEVQGSSGSAAGLAVDAQGDPFMGVLNKNGKSVAVFGVDENGHGALGILNASQQPVVGMGADRSGVGQLAISAGKFKAYVDKNGNGVAETQKQNGSLRWSSEPSSGGSGGTSSGLLGDLDQDGDVDFTDFLRFAANFGKTSG